MFLVFTLAVAGLVLTGCAGSQKKLTSESMPETFPCVDDDGKVEKMVAAEAEVVQKTPRARWPRLKSSVGPLEQAKPWAASYPGKQQKAW